VYSQFDSILDPTVLNQLPKVLSLFDFSVKKEEGRNESVDFLFYVAVSSMSVD